MKGRKTKIDSARRLVETWGEVDSSVAKGDWESSPKSLEAEGRVSKGTKGL